ncbi:MAG: hypothetical protein QN120_11640 [Armatimonadota bacterium]|nr:hypothetical protein [Armatimonadota bacterium]
MASRFDSLDAFRSAISPLGLPLTDEELRALWPMVNDLLEQAQALQRFLETVPDASLLVAGARQASDG